MDGTSFAAPIVSAIAAWVWSERQSLDRTQVFELLRRTARDVAKKGFDTRTGFGLVQLPAALDAPAPPVDPDEPNDDIDLITPGKVLSQGEPPLTSAGRKKAKLQARLDGFEDPRDVYRVFVPARRTVEIRVIPDANVRLFLWKQGTRSVLGPARNRLASSSKPGRQTEIIRFRNRSGRGLTLFVDVRIVGGGGASADYVLRVRTL